MIYLEAEGGAKPRRKGELEATSVNKDDTNEIIYRIPCPKRKDKGWS